VEVNTITIEAKDIPAVYEYVGFVKSSHEVEVRARVAGYLDSIDYAEGQLVKKEDLLFQIDPRPFEAALMSSKGDLAKQEAVLWDAKRSVERLKPLFEQKAASRRDLDNALAQEAANGALVGAAKANVLQAELNLAYTTIRSPVNGLVGASNYREGALIVTNESLLTTISVIDPIWINFSIPERDMLQSQEERKKGALKFPESGGFVIEAVLANGSILPELGKVNFFSPTYDQKTGTMMVRAELPNPEGILRPGQFVRARVSGAIRPGAISVPQRAVVQSKRGLFVYVVDKEDRAISRFIEAGEWDNDNWIINSGLKVGDVVIVDGVNKVQPGSLISTKVK
jgi:membrane fusion protein, multidrug efflux system